jgi:hypothetical protein
VLRALGGTSGDLGSGGGAGTSASASARHTQEHGLTFVPTMVLALSHAGTAVSVLVFILCWNVSYLTEYFVLEYPY